MMRARRLLGTAAAMLMAGMATSACAQPAAPAAIREPVSETGTAGGAPYRIDVPAQWNGGLVVFYHGYEVAGQRRSDAYRGLPGTEQLLRRGYAVIQSAYSRQGWAVAEALAETAALRARFERRFGSPTRVLAAGFSMGGHLALATIEQEPRTYDGALTMCGVNLPATGLFERAVSDLAAAAALFPGPIPDLDAASAPAHFDPAALTRAMADNPRAAQQLAVWTGIEAGDLPRALWLYYTAVRELRGRAGGFPASNIRTRYRGDPAALPYVRANAGLTGRLRDPVVLLNNSYDDLVSERTRTFYPAAVRAAGSRGLLTILPPVGRGHCGFTPEQVGAAFDRLVAEVERRGARR